MWKKFVSRKLLAAVAGVVSVVMVKAGMPEEQAQNVIDAIMWIVIAAIGGQAVEDAAGRLNSNHR